MVIVEIPIQHNEKQITYYMDKRIKDRLDNKVITALKKKDEDYVLAIDGGEGSGKSTYAFQIGKYVDPTLDLSRVTFNAEQFREAIFKANKGQCVIYDEAFTGFSSRASLSGINRILISLMMQMRQKNLFVIIVLPTFFLLDKYVALFRTRVLIHIYKNRKTDQKGYFRVYNRVQKKNLYLLGKQTYSYVPNKVKTRFRGVFRGVFALGDIKVEDKYRQLKDKALKDTEKNPMNAGQVKYREQRDLLMYILRKNTKLTYRMISNLLDDYDFAVSYAQVRNICAKFGDKELENESKEQIDLEKNEIDENNEELDEFESNIDESDG